MSVSGFTAVCDCAPITRRSEPDDPQHAAPGRLIPASRQYHFQNRARSRAVMPATPSVEKSNWARSFQRHQSPK